jgi:hypothetical protein
MNTITAGTRTIARAADIIGATAFALLLMLTATGCERGPSAEDVAQQESACHRQVTDWVGKQKGLGAIYDARPYYDAQRDRCIAHVRGGDAPASRFEAVVDVQQDRVIAGCSEAREAVGDTPCQVDGKPASRSAGRLTIDRLTGQ